MAPPPNDNQSAMPSQAKRVAKLTTPLGSDVLNAVRFSGSEGLSELFEFTIEAIAPKSLLSFDKAIGQNCSIEIRSKSGVDRPFCGVLTETKWLGIRDEHYVYQLTLRPWLWLLSRVSDCRIFHNMSVDKIIRQVFTDRGFSDFEMRLTESYPDRLYCVQYRESDLDFVCRLMEEEGIYFFFEHGDSKHVLKLVDAKSGHSAIKSLPKVAFARTERSRTDRETITDLIAGRAFQTGKIALTDYDPMKPTASMASDFTNDPNHTRGTLEAFDYPGHYTLTGEGDRFAKVRLQARQALDDRRTALGDAINLVPGGLVTLTEHPEASQNIEYLVVRASHRFEAQSYRTGGEEALQAYEGSYELQPSEKPYRAPQITPWPTVMGPQTAKVVGKKGEEIDVDEHGRILVHFHWDRRKDYSCRVRVAQTWSGKAWGTVFVPRIGQEVVVEHLEGNPDQPLCTGTVYNAEMTLPYELPANKTMSGWKSNSSKGGSGYNELVLEDKAKSELIRMHAQKDHEVVVLNTETWTIAEEFKGSGDSRTTTLKKGDDTLKVEDGNRTVEIAKDLTTKVGGDREAKVSGNDKESVTGKQEVSVTGKQDISVSGKITITSPSGIELKCGANKISLTPSGVTIDAIQTTVKAKTTMTVQGLNTTLKGDVQTNVQGLMTNVKADAILMASGALVKIN